MPPAGGTLGSVPFSLVARLPWMSPFGQVPTDCKRVQLLKKGH